MRQKRLIITSAISVILVSILFINGTYSVFTTTSVDEEVNTYQTGNLDIEIINEEDGVISNVMPTSLENSDYLSPYRIGVKNNGSVAYQFHIILDETTSSDKIDSKYIMTRVGVLDAKSLKSCGNNVLIDGVVVLPGETVFVDVRVWISDEVPNTEMNKSFFAKLKIDGEAIYSKNTDVDNDQLVNPIKSSNFQAQVQESDNKEKEE